jgi:hypothetical protein
MTPLADLQALLERFSIAWQTLDLEALRGILSAECVFVAPGGQGATRAVGRESCVDTYRHFLGAATVVAYKEGEAAIDVFGATAVAVVPWEMTWSMEGREESAKGRDVLVLQSDGTRWQILWRTQS